MLHIISLDLTYSMFLLVLWYGILFLRVLYMAGDKARVG